MGKGAVLTILGVFILVAGVASLTYFGPDLSRHFGMRYADADRQVYQESLSMVRGTTEHIQRLKLEYAKAETDAHKAALIEMVLTSASSIDETKLPPHLQSWVLELRRAR